MHEYFQIYNEYMRLFLKCYHPCQGYLKFRHIIPLFQPELLLVAHPDLICQLHNHVFYNVQDVHLFANGVRHRPLA